MKLTIQIFAIVALFSVALAARADPPSLEDCPCAAEASRCAPCGALEVTTIPACACAPKPNCPPCALAAAMKKLHGAAAKDVGQNIFSAL